MKTGDHSIVDEWAKLWPQEALETIENNILDYQRKVKFRTCAATPSISRPIEDSFQLVINYNTEKECFVVWNAAIQNHIHPKGKKIRPALGKDGEDLLHSIQENCIKPFYREIGSGSSNLVELVLFVGKNALPDFCKQYKELIKPNPKHIPKGKFCVFAVPGGKVEHIQSAEGI